MSINKELIADLLGKIVEGDESAISPFCEACEPIVMAQSVRLAHKWNNLLAADELGLFGFEHVLRYAMNSVGKPEKLDSVKTPATVITWLVAREMRVALRKEKQRVDKHGFDDDVEVESYIDPHSGDEVEHHDTMTDVLSCCKGDKDLEKIVNLRAANHTLEECAVELGVSATTISNKLNKLKATYEGATSA